MENVSLNYDNRLVIFREYGNVVTNSFSSVENSPDKVNSSQVAGIDLLSLYRRKFNWSDASFSPSLFSVLYVSYLYKFFFPFWKIFFSFILSFCLYLLVFSFFFFSSSASAGSTFYFVSPSFFSFILLINSTSFFIVFLLRQEGTSIM